MSRKKKHTHMSAEVATEGYAAVVREMFMGDVLGRARLRSLSPEIHKMRETLEALAMAPDGKHMDTERALYLLIQTATWLVEGMVSRINESCGHEECAKARMSGLSNAIGLVVAELLTQGRKAPELKEGALH